MTRRGRVGVVGRTVRDACRRSRSRHPGAVRAKFLAGRVKEITAAADGLLANGGEIEFQVPEVALWLAHRGWRAADVETLRAGYAAGSDQAVLSGARFVLVGCALGAVPGDGPGEQIEWAHAMTSWGHPLDAVMDLLGGGSVSHSVAAQKAAALEKVAPKGLGAAAYGAGMSVNEAAALTAADGDWVRVMAALRRGGPC